MGTRVDTDANWQSSNPTLSSGTIAISSDKTALGTGADVCYQYKVADGITPWASIAYANSVFKLPSDITQYYDAAGTLEAVGSGATGIQGLYGATGIKGSTNDPWTINASLRSNLSGMDSTSGIYCVLGNGHTGIMPVYWHS